MRKSMMEQARQRLETGLEAAGKQGASGAKISFRQEEQIGVDFENGRLKTSNTRQSVSYHVEVLVDGRRGGAMGNNLDELEVIVARAIALAGVGSAAHFIAYPAPGKLAEVKTHSPRTVGLARQTMVDACQAIADQLKAYDSEMFISASAERSESEYLLVTSGGVRQADTQTRWSLGSYVQKTEGTDMLFAGRERLGVDLDEQFDADWIAAGMLEDLRNGEKIVDAPTGQTRALIVPHMLATLLRPLEMGVNGRSVAKGDSPLKGRLGEKIFDESLTIIDDPHTDFCNGGRTTDDDGVPTRVVPIVTNGVLENFLYDLDSAGLAGAEPTGNDGCSSYSLTVSPGAIASDEMLAGIDDGIVIKQLIGFGMSNLINGDFSCNLGLGFRVKDGKIVGRVKDTMVAGNFYDLLADGVQLSSNVDKVWRMPHAVIDGINVSTS